MANLKTKLVTALLTSALMSSVNAETGIKAGINIPLSKAPITYSVEVINSKIDYKDGKTTTTKANPEFGGTHGTITTETEKLYNGVTNIGVGYTGNFTTQKDKGVFGSIEKLNEGKLGAKLQIDLTNPINDTNISLGNRNSKITYGKNQGIGLNLEVDNLNLKNSKKKTLNSYKHCPIPSQWDGSTCI